MLRRPYIKKDRAEIIKKDTELDHYKASDGEPSATHGWQQTSAPALKRIVGDDD